MVRAATERGQRPPEEPEGSHRSRRRRWIGLGACLALPVLLLVGAAAIGLGYYGWNVWHAPVSNVGQLSFANELRIPPLAPSSIDAEGRRRFDLTFQAGETSFLDGAATETWGLNGSYLAPTLRASRGETVQVDVTNGVDEDTTLHWHGMALPAAMDGGPHQMIEPGATWSPTWTIDQPASTLWFHPHLHGATAEQVYRGAAGMFIVDDPESSALDLPSTYGVDDVPVIVQDRNFDGDNQFTGARTGIDQTGILGDEILVNGTHDPHLDVTTELVRLRVLNASNGRIYSLGLDDGRPFHLVGTDGGLLASPASMTSLRLSPGERAEIVVAMAPGERVVLRSGHPDLGVNGLQSRLVGGEDSFDLLELRAAEHLDPSAPLPARLAEVDPPSSGESVQTRTFDLGNDRINGRQMEMDRIDQVVTAGTVEIWEITNDHSLPHSFHPHLVHVAVLDVDGRPPPPELSGWKDTLYVPPDTTIRVIARFDGTPDPAVPYMFHCHVLAHEDAGMMGQFLLVEPGTVVDDRLPGLGGTHDHG